MPCANPKSRNWSTILTVWCWNGCRRRRKLNSPAQTLQRRIPNLNTSRLQNGGSDCVHGFPRRPDAIRNSNSIKRITDDANFRKLRQHFFHCRHAFQMADFVLRQGGLPAKDAREPRLSLEAKDFP